MDLTAFMTWWQSPTVEVVRTVITSAIDIILVAMVIYWVLYLIRGTLAQQVLTGLFLMLLVFLGAKIFNLKTLSWILETFTSSLLVLIIVVFQHDIRRVLSRVGGNTLWSRSSAERGALLVEEVSRACASMARQRIGAIIVIEREGNLSELAVTGDKLDAQLSAPLLEQIFWPKGPLHDGAVIIQQGRIAAARVVLPLTRNPHLDPQLGTRHRAAIGVTEEYDSMAVVVSEERGQISIAENGQITRDLDEDVLRQVLQKYFEPRPRK